MAMRTNAPSTLRPHTYEAAGMYVKKDFLCVARTLPGMPEVRWVALPHCCAAHVPHTPYCASQPPPCCSPTACRACHDVAVGGAPSQMFIHARMAAWLHGWMPRRALMIIWPSSLRRKSIGLCVDGMNEDGLVMVNLWQEVSGGESTQRQCTMDQVACPRLRVPL